MRESSGKERVLMGTDGANKTGEKVSIVSLGCAKNQVDAEAMLRRLRDAGYELTDDPSKAACVIVNTCGFLESARAEAVESIIELGKLKPEGTIKAIIVSGCLSQLEKENILDQMPEVDGVVGLSGANNIEEHVKRALSGERFAMTEEPEKLRIDMPRILGNEPHYAYLKIAEGCDNRCSYCLIPTIRGRFRSRSMESILSEAEELAKKGVKELDVVAQDTTRYGEDNYGAPMLPELLRRLCGIDGIHWIRVLYGYPDRVSDELLTVMREEEKIVKYLDLPLQHCDGGILKSMNRRGDEASLRNLISRIRSAVPGITLRTTLIAGLPGEGEREFEALAAFVKDMKFDRLGVFPYSREDGTPAWSFPGQVDEETKYRRTEIIMEEQFDIMERLNRKKLGSTAEVLTEGWDSYIKMCYGRTAADAPDVDGKVFFTPSGKRPAPGDFVTVRFTDVLDYDLMGEQV